MTSKEPPIVRLFRDTLESVVAPHVASAALFEALQEIGGDLPAGEADLLAVAHGPLRDALARRLGAPAAKSAVARITEAVLTADAPTGRPSRPLERPSIPTTAFDEEDTAKIPTDVLADSVLIAAAGERLRNQLRTALGPSRVHIEAASSATRLATVLASLPPAMVIVDATDFPPVEPEILAGALSKPPPSTIRAIWGSDLIYGTRVVRALESAGCGCSPMDRTSGIEPLLDLIRSRSSTRDAR